MRYNIGTLPSVLKGCFDKLKVVTHIYVTCQSKQNMGRVLNVRYNIGKLPLVLKGCFDKLKVVTHIYVTCQSKQNMG